MSSTASVTLVQEYCSASCRPRFPSLALSGEGAGLSWTRTGALVPASTSPSKVFAKLFLDGRPEEVQVQVNRLADGRSILDDVRDQAGKPRVWRTHATRIGRA